MRVSKRAQNGESHIVVDHGLYTAIAKVDISDDQHGQSFASCSTADDELVLTLTQQEVEMIVVAFARHREQCSFCANSRTMYTTTFLTEPRRTK